MTTSERHELAARPGGVARGEPRHGRRLPAGLGALLLITLVLTTTWAIATPAWQAPDEPAHFSYTQAIVELGRLPGGEGRADSTEVSRSTAAANTDQVVFNRRAQPPFDDAPRRAFAETATDAERRDGGGPSSTSTYPPLYYALEALPYLAVRSGDIYTRMTAMRIFSGLWALLTVTAAWLLIGELTRRNRLAQLTGAATVGLWPLLTFVSAGLNPDGLLIALWTLAMWLGVRVLRRGLTLGDGLALGLVTGAALVTKSASLVLAPIVVAVLLWAAWRGRRTAGRTLLALVVSVAVLAAPLAAYTVQARSSDKPAFAQASEISTATGTGFKPRQFASYLWQFYLPKLPFMNPRINNQIPVISSKPALNIWLGSGSAVFGWVNVWFPAWVYWILGGALGLMALLFAAACARWWRGASKASRRRAAAPVLFLAAVGILTLGALHYADYGYYANNRGFFIQGRYLLPLAGLLAAFAGLAVAGLPRRVAWPVAAVWLGGLVAFQFASLGLTVARFYA